MVREIHRQVVWCTCLRCAPHFFDMTLIALTTQNRRTITNHAGRCRRFALARVIDGMVQQPVELVELEIEQTLRQGAKDLPAALQGIEVLITAGAGHGMVQNLATHGVQVCVTGLQDPMEALQTWARGQLPHVLPASLDHGDDKGAGSACQCSCQSGKSTEDRSR